MCTRFKEKNIPKGKKRKKRENENDKKKKNRKRTVTIRLLKHLEKMTRSYEKWLNSETREHVRRMRAHTHPLQCINYILIKLRIK